jgi:hypothetical protein
VTRTDAELWRRAVHEAGHALVALAHPGAAACARTSILACGRAAGAPVAWSASSRRQVSTGPELVSELVVLLAGRAAELAVAGSASTLSEGDLVRAGEIAALVEQTGLAPTGVPGTASGLMEWAEHEATELVGRKVQPLEEVATALHSTGSMFIEDLRALIGAPEHPAPTPQAD